MSFGRPTTMDNTTVDSYINKQGGAHSQLHLAVDLSVASISGHNHQRQARSGLSERDSRLPVLAKSANNDRVESPPPDHDSHLQDMGTPTVDMFAKVHCTNLPHFMSPIPEPQALAIDALSQDWQGRSMYMFPPGWRDNFNRPLVAVTTMVPTSSLSVCGPPSHHSIPPGPTVTKLVYLGRQVVPSARMDAVMQHYQAAGFSEEVSRLAAAPTIPSTNNVR